MNEIELYYDPKIGITNLDDISQLNTLPKFQENIKGILKVHINNGFSKRNTKKLCAIVLPLVLLLVIGCTLLAILLFPHGFGLIGGTITAIVGLIIGYFIYRNGSIKYIKDIEKKVRKKTRETCKVKFYHNNKPYEETIGCCGVVLNKDSLIFVVSDPEKLITVKQQLQVEEARKKHQYLPQELKNMINMQNQQGQTVNVMIVDGKGQMKQESFTPQNPLIPEVSPNQPVYNPQMQAIPKNNMVDQNVQNLNAGNNPYSFGAPPKTSNI